MSAVPPMSVQVILVRVTPLPVPVEVSPGVSLRMTAKRMKAARTMLTRTMLTQTSAAPTLLLPGVLPSRVERPGQAKAPASMCCEGS
jgi:hypothetical protein